MSYIDTLPSGFCLFEGRNPAGGATVWSLQPMGWGLNSSRALTRVMSAVLCASPEAKDHVCISHLYHWFPDTTPTANVRVTHVTGLESRAHLFSRLSHV